MVSAGGFDQQPSRILLFLPHMVPIIRLAIILGHVFNLEPLQKTNLYNFAWFGLVVAQQKGFHLKVRQKSNRLESESRSEDYSCHSLLPSGHTLSCCSRITEALTGVFVFPSNLVALASYSSIFISSGENDPSL